MGQKHESWSVLWGVPRPRSLADDACISNSVAVRVAGDAGYRPERLMVAGNALGDGYSVVDVVDVPVVAG